MYDRRMACGEAIGDGRRTRAGPSHGEPRAEEEATSRGRRHPAAMGRKKETQGSSDTERQLKQ